MDERFRIIKERLSSLSVSELQRIVDNIDIVCFDEFNYNAAEKTYCPLAVALNLHRIVENPSDAVIADELVKRFVPVNIVKGVKGEFYTKNRKKDLLNLCLGLIEEKNFE